MAEIEIEKTDDLVKRKPDVKEEEVPPEYSPPEDEIDLGTDLKTVLKADDMGARHTPRHTPKPSLSLPTGNVAPVPLPSAGPSNKTLNTLRSIPPPGAPPQPSWADMPRKTQVLVLFLSRFADFFQMACLQAIMFHQLQSFDPTASDATISYQAGVLTGAFTSAQIFTGLLLGRIADYPTVGRKRILLLGFLGTALSCIGVAFSRSFGAAVAWRCMAGAVNGTVGSARTMLAESVPKPWHSRAFLVLPLAFNVANIFGPVFGGALADPVELYPKWFGKNSTFGGSTGVTWMQAFPYAAPSLLSAFVCLCEALLVWLVAFETLESRRDLRDRGRELGRSIYALVSKCIFRHQGYSILPGEEALAEDVELSPRLPKETPQPQPTIRQVLPFSRIWTKNVLFTLASIALFDFHMGAFASLWLVFLSTSRTSTPPRSTLEFSGGLSFPPPTIGWAMSILGAIGITLQLTLYPKLSSRLGLVRSFRWSLALFPLAYFLTPFLARLPSTSMPPAPAAGIPIWLGIAVVLFLQVAARTFALPASILLLNNSAPHPSVLATIHGLGSSTSSAFRTIGPMVAGRWFADGLRAGMVGWAWWLVALVSVGGAIIAWWVKNGSGHEILLEGERRGSTGVVKQSREE